MFGFSDNDGLKPKCYFTCSVLPAFIDHDQLPNKKRPFSTILDQRFTHSVNIVLPKPKKCGNDLETTLQDASYSLQYQSVYMKLCDIIEGEFFNHYIKAGNVIMLAEGRPGIDPTYSLHEGILRLEVDRPTYERMGLEGKPIPSEGRKHVKARFAIELNLRLPSMVRGKKGFDRVVWAFKNVPISSLKWLFYDVKQKKDGSGPIADFQPRTKTVEFSVDQFRDVKMPVLPEDMAGISDDDAVELLEWISLANIISPRLQRDDQLDTYLSRYKVPLPSDESSSTNSIEAQELLVLRFRGFMPPEFVRKIFLASLKATDDSWLALTAHSMTGEAYTFLHKDHRTMTWEYVD